MKKIIKVLSILSAILICFSACTATIAESSVDSGNISTTNAPTGNGNEGNNVDKDKTYGTVLNIDSDALSNFYQKYNKDITGIEAKLVEFFNGRYQDSGLSDIIYDLSVNVPSTTWDSKIDKYTRTEENGVAVDYSGNIGCEASYRIYKETDTDPYQVWMDLCREQNINPWLSFRMNDVHYANEPTGHSAFFYTAKENGWMIGNSRSAYWATGTTTGSRAWYQYALDYSVAEVRQYFLDNIDEMLDRYDVYGIELDWQRTIWCFSEDSVENCIFMNIFMEEVNKIVAKYEEKYGHEIKIMARIARDIDDNKFFGFDARNWAENKWIDVIVPCSYWGSTDNDMPIAAWVDALKDYEVEIYAGLECHTVNSNFWQSLESLSGYSAAYFSQGADKIYLFNMFNDIKAKFLVCSSPERAMAAAKRSYIVTESNCDPYLAGMEVYDPLPLTLKVNEESTAVTVNHGTLNYNQNTVIYVGIMGISANEIDKETLEVMYNGTLCTFVGISVKSHLGDKTTFGTVVEFRVPSNAAQNSTVGVITFEPGTNQTIGYLEIMNGNSRI